MPLLKILVEQFCSWLFLHFQVRGLPLLSFVNCLVYSILCQNSSVVWDPTLSDKCYIVPKLPKNIPQASVVHWSTLGPLYIWLMPKKTKGVSLEEIESSTSATLSCMTCSQAPHFSSILWAPHCTLPNLPTYGFSKNHLCCCRPMHDVSSFLQCQQPRTTRLCMLLKDLSQCCKESATSQMLVLVVAC